jgi:hypothetical protein
MSKYKVVLYFFFGPTVATVNGVPDGEPLIFDTIQEANQYGRSKAPILYEPLELKDE